jgi:hypothetical protein
VVDLSILKALGIDPDEELLKAMKSIDDLGDESPADFIVRKLKESGESIVYTGDEKHN